ncbi:PsiF family protein [Noviherbaspirillum aridicola]|uniref:Phosphate starvation-inducible protein PsiF n=1 Tax=Noviherbaspirillum aridicola TaxID=2849687 RepID=A0ABQ4Q401_9BURK|nr:PsiF family protein [Noviherbaspirillum aridicola]GIZ51756.1 phosphate starvation-inducible protein PsiF [Noviherbaspirillum aridicola]
MKHLAFALLIALPALASTAHAANEQQNKMAACNKEATGMKGDERKTFMKECLSKPAATTPQKAQQERMKTCNAEAKGKTGDERKQFMSQCLKKPAAS